MLKETLRRLGLYAPQHRFTSHRRRSDAIRHDQLSSVLVYQVPRDDNPHDVPASHLDTRSFGFTVIDTNPTVPEPCSFTYWAPHYISWYLIGTGEDETAANNRLMDKLNRAIKPYAKGYYLNEVDLEVAPYMANQCFSQEKWEKLVDLRKKYDPSNRFFSYLNQEKDGAVVSDF